MTTNGYDAVTVSDDLVPRPRSLPMAVRRMPSMMSSEERTLLYALAKNRYTGEGYIVDAGIFLGGSTVCFGQGIIDRGSNAPDKPIISYDQALVTPGMLAFFRRKKLYVELKLGDDLRPTILENTRTVSDLVDYRFGDIMEENWDPSRLIEICFLDVLKTPEINRFAVRNFFPALSPGKSYVIQQDYFYHRLPYIKVYQEFFSEYFEFVGMVKTSGVFLLTKPIPAERLEMDLFRELESADLMKLHRQVEGRATGADGRKLMVALSGVELKLMTETPAAAREELERVKSDYAAFIQTDSTGHAAKVINELVDLVDESADDRGVIQSWYSFVRSAVIRVFAAGGRWFS